MDKEQARFILQSFRPNGEDSSDADFRDALRLAVEDRELGQWLADERAADAAFATAVNEIEIPEQLRLNLLAVIRGEAPEDPSLHEEMDGLLQQALAAVEPPGGLRDQILAAMEVEQNTRAATRGGQVVQLPRRLGKWLSVAAVAAALALGAFLAFQVTDERKAGGLASYQIQQTAGRVLNGDPTFDVADGDSTHLTTWLAEHRLPAPDGMSELPPRLRALKAVGCKKIQLAGGKAASVVCFAAGENKKMHLVIVNNEDVSDLDLPTADRVSMADCYNCTATDWNVVRWRSDRHTFILLAKDNTATKTDLVNYF